MILRVVPILLVLCLCLGGCFGSSPEEPGAEPIRGHPIAWQDEADITLELDANVRAFSVYLAPDATAILRLEFAGEPPLKGQQAAWEALPGYARAGIAVGFASHGQVIGSKALFAEAGEGALIDAGAPIVGDVSLGPPGPNPGREVLQELDHVLDWTFDLSDEHYHFAVAAHHARAEVRVHAVSMSGAGVRLLDDGDGSSMVEVRVFPNPDDWDVSAQLLVTHRGAVAMGATTWVDSPRNLFILGAQGPGSSLRVGSCSSPWGIGAAHGIIGQGLDDGSYDLSVTMTPLTLGETSALWLLFQVPEHDPPGYRRQC